MSKRTPTKNIFDMLAEHDDGEPDTAQPTPELEAADNAPDSKAAAAETQSDEETATETTEDDQTDGAPTRGPLRRRVVAVLAGVVVAVILGLSGLSGWRLKQLDDTAAAGKAALEAARNYAVILTTLDAKDLDGNYRQALDGATGEFKDEYSQGSSQLRQILIDNKAAGKGLVVDAAVKSATKTKVEVLLFVDQSVTNAVNPSPRIDRNRVEMTMELIDKRWLASKVDII
jgi:Mce-associated membrane protein